MIDLTIVYERRSEKKIYVPGQLGEYLRFRHQPRGRFQSTAKFESLFLIDGECVCEREREREKDRTILYLLRFLMIVSESLTHV